MILTSNRGFAEWAEVFGDPVVATALLDRLPHHAVVVQMEGASYRLRAHDDLIHEHVRANASITPPPPKRRGRPPKNRSAADQKTDDLQNQKWGNLLRHLCGKIQSVLTFDPFSLFQNGLPASEVDIGGREVLQAVVVAPVIVMVDKGHRPVVGGHQAGSSFPARCGSSGSGASVRSCPGFAGDTARPGRVPSADLPAIRQAHQGCGWTRYHSADAACAARLPDHSPRLVRRAPACRSHPRLHRRAKLPGDDAPAVIIQDRAEIEPAPADHF